MYCIVLPHPHPCAFINNILFYSKLFEYIVIGSKLMQPMRVWILYSVKIQHNNTILIFWRPRVTLTENQIIIEKHH